MKSRIFSALLAITFIAVACVFVAGCRRPPRPPDSGVIVEPPAGESDKVFHEARDTFRFNRPADDWTRFRDFFPRLAGYFARPEIQASLQFKDAERKYLADEAHLSSAEIADLEASDFRPADAHYLDECYLFRDVARSLEAASLDTPERQARALFGWAMRNVLLHEQTDTWIPPAFTLRRGFGGPVDRALVALALLRQEKLDGCLIVVPDSEPLQFLIGVPDAQSSSLMLFDARLGLPVPAKDGKSIARLKEVQADPKLLAAAQITPEQVKKLEAWLVCPYHALSPRMLELQDQLGRLDRVILFQDPLALSKEIARVGGIPVKVWNPPAAGAKTANSPTRALELFLPKDQGGKDMTGRAAFLAHARMPVGAVLVNFGQINIVAHGILPGPVYDRLIGIAGDFLVKCDLQPREMYLRGQYEAMRQRQEHIVPLVKTDAFASDKAFLAERLQWFKELDAAASVAADEKSAARAKAQQFLESLGGTDFLLHWMRDTDSEKKLADVERELRDQNIKGDQRRSVPTKILAVGLRDHFDFELARSQAAVAHEKAERAQAFVNHQAKPSDAALKRASEGWIMAKSAWANFYVNRIPLESTIDQRLEQIRRNVRPIVRKGPLEELELKLSLLELVHLDVQRYFNAKLRLAECLAHTDPSGIKGANAYLDKTRAEIEQMESKGKLREEIKILQEALPRLGMDEAIRSVFQRRLELLSHDWSANGSYYWLKQQIALRIK